MKMKAIGAALFAAFWIVAASISSAAPPDHSKGRPPEKFYWVDVFGGPSTFTGPLLPCDGFDVNITITYQGFWVVYPDTPGREDFESYQSITPISLSNSEDPSIFVESIPGSHVSRRWTGTAFETDPIDTGVQIMITLPGYGQIFRDVGRLRVDWDTLEPEFIAGEWQSWGDDYDALCAALTP